MPVKMNNSLEVKKSIARITENAAFLLKKIDAHRKELINELLKYESFETANDEIWRSLNCLENISKELENLSSAKVNLMCTIFPVNLPLYSLVIFAIVPGFMADELIIRPPVLARETVKKISKIIDLEAVMPNIKFVELEREMFTEAYISIADVVLFTGRYDNAKLVHSACPDALFIYNGAGVNPIVITQSAELKLAVEKTVEMKIFNSGQDCAGADLILVNEKIEKEFISALLEQLRTIKIGDYADKNVRVGSLVKADHLLMIKDFFKQHSPSLIYGGKIDMGKKTVYPTVIIENIHKIENFKMIEFFSPIFYILVYHNTEDLSRYFNQNSYSDFAMYVSIFGDRSIEQVIPNSVILENKIINDVERGNNPYGGYGKKANYVSHTGACNSYPVLISKEIANYAKAAEVNNRKPDSKTSATIKEIRLES